MFWRRVRDYAARALLPSVVGSNPGGLIPIDLNKKSNQFGCFFSCAESEGFEPPEPLGSTVFKTAAIDHSANSPGQK